MLDTFFVHCFSLQVNCFERIGVSSLPEGMSKVYHVSNYIERSALRKYVYLIGVAFMIASLIQYWLLSLSRKTYKYLKDSQAAAKIPEVIMTQM